MSEINLFDAFTEAVDKARADRVYIQLAPGPGREAADVEQDLAAQIDHGVAIAHEHLLAGRRGRALYELTRSLERQLRIAGLGSVPVVQGEVTR